MRPAVALVIAAPAAAAAALLPLPAAALLILTAAAFTLILQDAVWAPALAVMSVPVQQLISLPGGLSVTQALTALTVVSWVIHSRNGPLSRGTAAFGLFVWILALSAAFSPYSVHDGIVQSTRWAAAALVYTAAVSALRDDTDGGRRLVLTVAVLAAALISAVIGLVQYRYGIGPASFGIGNGHVRAYGTIGQPNSFAGYLNQAWPTAVGLLIALIVRPRCGRLLWPALAAGGAAAVILAGLLVSFSRGGWLGAGAGLLIALLLLVQQSAADQRRRVLRQIGGPWALTVAAVLVLAGGALVPAVSSRLSSLLTALQPIDLRAVEITDANFAIVERTAHLQAALVMIGERPWLGVGPGSYDAAYERPDRPDQPAVWFRPWAESRGHAHNYYLHIAAEAGLAGLAAYLLLLGVLAQTMLRQLRAARGRMELGAAIGGLIMLAAVGGHNLFENLHVLNIGLQFAAVAALAGAQSGQTDKGAQP